MQTSIDAPRSQTDRSVRATDWLRVIQAEFTELPDLELTQWQAQRLWNLDATVCEALLTALVAAGFLRLTPAGYYVRRRAVH